MDLILQNLNERSNELDEYLELITYLSTSNSLQNNNGLCIKINSHLVKTLKGATYLLLYNLIESTIRGAIEAIHDKIANSETTFEDLREQLQLKVLKAVKGDKINIESLLAQIKNNISLKLAQSTLDKRNFLSGNVDSKKIKEIANEYGFSHETNNMRTADGHRLLEVKTNRNNLAHGNSTFTNAGSNISIEDLQRLCNEVVAYIYEICDNVTDYIENDKYRNC